MKCKFLASIVLLCGVLILHQRAFAQTSQPGDSPATQPDPGHVDTSIPRPDVPLPPGMKPLFDGKTLDGWVQEPAKTWTVQDGMLADLGTARGELYTSEQFKNYRVIFDVRHVSGTKPDHFPCVLIFGFTPADGEKPQDALGAIQFQPPVGYGWDYRKGHNNSGKGEYTSLKHPKYDQKQWSRIELLVNATNGTARMAVAQPVGSDATEVLDFKVPDAGRTGPFALQVHNKGLFDDYANIAIEVNPTNDDLITVKAKP